MHTVTTLRQRTTAIAALCAGLSGPATAAGGHAALDLTPGGKFSKEDYALMMARVNEALNADKDGETLDWKNDKSPASGSVTSLGRLVWEGLPCRRLRIHNAYGELKAKGVYKFCEKPPGRWKLMGPKESPT